MHPLLPQAYWPKPTGMLIWKNCTTDTHCMAGTPTWATAPAATGRLYNPLVFARTTGAASGVWRCSRNFLRQMHSFNFYGNKSPIRVAKSSLALMRRGSPAAARHAVRRVVVGPQPVAAGILLPHGATKAQCP